MKSLYRNAVFCLLTLAVAGAGAPALAQEPDLSTPAAAAKNAISLFEAGKLDEFCSQYHPDASNGKMYIRLKRNAREHYDNLMQIMGEMTLTVLKKLQLSSEIGEPVMEGDLANVNVSYTSASVPAYSYQFTMSLKQGPALSGEGTAWRIWYDGLEGFFGAAEQVDSDIATMMVGTREKMVNQSREYLEQEVSQKRAEAIASPEGCARVLAHYLPLGNTPVIDELLHPDCPARKAAVQMEGVAAGASDVDARYRARLSRLVFDELDLRPEIGAAVLDGQTAKVPFVLKSEKKPDVEIRTELEVHQDPHGNWCLWNSDAVFGLIEKTGSEQVSLASEVKKEKESRQKRLESMGIREEIMAVAPECGSPEEAVTALLTALSAGKPAEAEVLFHPDAPRVARFKLLVKGGESKPDVLKKLMSTTGELYRLLFEGEGVTYQLGAISEENGDTRVAVDLSSKVKTDWSEQTDVTVRKYTPEDGKETWRVWDSKLLDTLMHAAEGDEAVAEKLKALADEVTSLEKDLEGAAPEEASEEAAAPPEPEAQAVSPESAAPESAPAETTQETAPAASTPTEQEPAAETPTAPEPAGAEVERDGAAQ